MLHKEKASHQLIIRHQNEEKQRDKQTSNGEVTEQTQGKRKFVYFAPGSLCLFLSLSLLSFRMTRSIIRQRVLLSQTSTCTSPYSSRTTTKSTRTYYVHTTKTLTSHVVNKPSKLFCTRRRTSVSFYFVCPSLVSIWFWLRNRISNLTKKGFLFSSQEESRRSTILIIHCPV